MNLFVAHTTQYHYPEPAHDSFNELWLEPVNDSRQIVVDFEIEVNPRVPIQSRLDYYGNRVHFFHIPELHRALFIETRSRVVTYQTPEPQPVFATELATLRPHFFEFLVPTRRVPLDRDWPTEINYPQPRPDESLVTYIETLTRYIHDTFAYDGNATHVNTPIEEFFRNRAGVCQDYAHAMLALCRSVGIPARYVSGYLHVGVGAEGSHAWVEVYLPGSGWIGFDPTNGTIVDEQYVKVAHGKDYDDCPPLRGLRRGGGQERLMVSLHVAAEEEAPANVD